MHVLVLNCGSSSIKAAVLDPATGARAAGLRVERLGTAEAVARWGDHVVELGGRHPAVCGQDPRFRHKSRQTVEDTLQVVDARADTKDLTPAEHLALDRLT